MRTPDRPHQNRPHPSRFRFGRRVLPAARRRALRPGDRRDARLCTLAVAALTVLACLAACAVPPLQGPGGSPPPRLTGLVFAVSSSGGLVPQIAVARAGPRLLVYGDGRVFRNTAPWGQTATYVVARTTPETVARFVAEAERDPLFAGKVDLGMPKVTDLGVTVVRLHGSTGEHSVSVYGFSEQFDRYVSWSQRRHRAALRDVIAQAEGLAGDAPFQPYDPQLVAVTRLPDFDDGSTGHRPPAWPGPDPASLLVGTDRRGRPCGLVRGPAAAALATAAAGNPRARWAVGGDAMVLAVNTDPEAATWCRVR